MDAVFFIFVMHIDSLWRLLLIVIPQWQQNVRFTAVVESQGKFADNHVGRVYYFFIFVGYF